MPIFGGDNGRGRRGRGKASAEAGVRPSATASALPRTSVPGAAAPGAAHRAATSFEARFGRTILRHGIAAIPAGLFHFQGRLGLDAKHLWFVCYVLSCKWDADLPYPSLNKMERLTGVNVQALYRYQKALVAQGYLNVVRRTTPLGGVDSNAYDFSALFERLEGIITEEGPQPNSIQAASAPTEAPSLAEIDSSFIARYGRSIVRYGVAAVPRALFTHQKALGLTPQQVWFVGYILSFKWHTGLPYPSIERMSYNTGYSRAYLHEIKTSLVAAEYLRLIHRTNEQGGQDSNAYDFSGLLDAVREQLEPQEPEPQTEQSTADAPQALPVQPARRGRAAARARASHAPFTEENAPDEAGITRQNPPGIIQHTVVGIAQYTDPHIKGQIGGGVTGQIGAGSKEQTTHVLSTRPGDVSPGRRGKVSKDRHESEAVKVENNKDDSNQITLKNESETELTKPVSEAPLSYSPYIAAVVTDFSDELGNSSHVVSNVTQALRIYMKSGLDEEEFSTLLFEARRLVRLHQGKQGLGTINNKMAYFFSILRGLCTGK